MKLLFENWRRFLKESERPGPGHTKSKYEQCPEKIAFDGFAKATYDATGEPGGFLNEQEEPFPYQIYCDMDGVLVDLIGAVLDHSQNDPSNKALRKEVANILKIEWGWTKKNPKLQKGLDYINDMVSDDIEFWAKLPPMPDKDQLWSYISQYDPIVLSHPWDEDSATGKRIWVKELINPQPKNVILTGDKHIYAVNEDGSPNLLIDDFEKYTIPWENAGGIAILHTSAEDTIKKLISLGENK